MGCVVIGDFHTDHHHLCWKFYCKAQHKTIYGHKKKVYLEQNIISIASHCMELGHFMLHFTIFIMFSYEMQTKASNGNLFVSVVNPLSLVCRILIFWRLLYYFSSIYFNDILLSLFQWHDQICVNMKEGSITLKERESKCTSYIDFPLIDVGWCEWCLGNTHSLIQWYDQLCDHFYST